MASNRNSMPCPECGGRVRTLTSRLLSDNVREIYFDCVNEDCLCRFVGHLGIVRTLIPRLPRSDNASPPMVERRANDIVMPRTAEVTASFTLMAPPAPPDHASALPALH